MLSPVITAKERALEGRVRDRAPRDLWDNALNRLKEATGLRYDALAENGVRLVISHCEIIAGLPRYNARTVFEPVGHYATREEMLDDCARLLESRAAAG